MINDDYKQFYTLPLSIKLMIQPIPIGLKSIQIAEDFIQNSNKLTYESHYLHKIIEKEELLNQQLISTQELIKSIEIIVHDCSFSIQKKVQMVRQILAKPQKAEIILVNSEYIKSGEAQRHKIKNGLHNPERSVIIEQSYLLGYEKDKRKVKVQKKQKDVQVIDSMFNDSIFNKIEPVINKDKFIDRKQQIQLNDQFENDQQSNKSNRVRNVKDIGNDSGVKISLPRDEHADLKEQLQKVKQQNQRLKKQLSTIKKMILSGVRSSKNSSHINIDLSQHFQITKFLTESILEQKSIYQSFIQNQTTQQKPDKIRESLNSLQQKYKILDNQLANERKIKIEQKETYKKNIKQYQSQISALKNKIANPCGKNYTDILNYLNHSFSKIHQNSTKSKCANMIITQVSSYLSK